jgi:hypothetical protein
MEADPLKLATHRSRGARSVLALALAVGAGALAAGGCGSSEETPSATLAAATRASSAPCAGSAESTLSSTLGEVGERIYRGELSRTGPVATAIASVTRSTTLARAVAAGDPVATKAAVTGIVYNHLHIVRLRVIHNGRVLSDVGGPFVLAPLEGAIRLNGRTVGRYVLSIQDDLGYLLLSGRLAGMQVVMRAHGRQFMSSVRPAPPPIPEHGALTLGGVTYVIHTIDATAFPSGPLRIHLLIPLPSQPFGARTCSQIKVAALGEVGMHVAQRYVLSPSNYNAYVTVAKDLTGAGVLIREGSRQLAGSISSAPRRLPGSGRVSIRGQSYGVFSFSAPTAAGTPVRIYLLVRGA